ncbi:hypothetical protein DE4585_02390 [Mycobacteroides salmoniphilum]|uniref:Uncharacterized protein n=1 Tax=Mycobacteroides salmoniphilum TaxID=404941 RepID=A0A4V3HYG1_9MYCO|nr:hypothetical protein [Mycobacteroides salmoniphilum]TDZ75999.1 hypothetical protein DE4586_03905 [Mycobacteroides salmoniphilum]TDZ83583.1 hypothetical protein DE4585_02390 [Mycobacteroides salmoniphilum]TDZ84517.1 hypothetical protein DE4587_03443 [Mycobacteroides salmoniphilum]
MKLINEFGVWATGPAPAPVGAVAVLEVSGAVLSWPIDDPSHPPVISFTDAARADWMWRVLGEAGHVAVIEALRDPDSTEVIELQSVTVPAGSTDSLRRLALGHWLRRWWPSSRRDGIVALDRPVLDAELAVLTAAAEDYFTDDTLDADVAELLAPHGAALGSYRDPRVDALVARCRDLADDVGLQWGAQGAAATRREDYALAAGLDEESSGSGVIASGDVTIAWSDVPPAIFDAAERNLAWGIVAEGATVVAQLRAALSGPESAAGIPVSLCCGAFHGAGALDAEGAAILPVFDGDGRPVDEAQAWNADWSAARVSVGNGEATESSELRDRVRAFARARLATPAGDAFLAELLAAESDY